MWEVLKGLLEGQHYRFVHRKFLQKKMAYDIYRLFHGWWARTIFIHKLCKTNERAQRVSLFYTTSE